jgi:hypothetical protein
MCRGTKEGGGTEDTGTEKRKKTILQNRATYHRTRIILITKKLGRERKKGKRTQKGKKEWKTRSAATGTLLEAEARER